MRPVRRARSRKFGGPPKPTLISEGRFSPGQRGVPEFQTGCVFATSSLQHVSMYTCSTDAFQVCRGGREIKPNRNRRPEMNQNGFTWKQSKPYFDRHESNRFLCAQSRQNKQGTHAMHDMLTPNMHQKARCTCTQCALLRHRLHTLRQCQAYMHACVHAGIHASGTGVEGAAMHA